MLGIHFKNSTLLRYNLHVVICIHFECAVWWVLTNIYTCVTTTQSRYRNFHHPRKFPHTSLQSIINASQRQPQSNFYHSRLVLPVSELHKNGITYVLLCIWLLWVNIMFLRFIHVVACTSRLFFVIAKYSFHCMDIAWFVHSLVVGHLDWLSWIKLLWTFLYRSFCVHMFSLG